MQNLVEKYNIPPTFYRRYFRYNAEMFYTIALQDFMLFKKGTFLNPLKKGEYISQIVEQEIDNFYNKNQINIAKLDFDLTTRCSLKCKYCSNLMPKFAQMVKEKKIKHIDTSFEEFKNIMDNLTSVIHKIGVLQILGGEPLLCANLPEILDYCGKNSVIHSVKIITNGTIVPNEKLLQVIEKYKDKIFFYISNYSANPQLEKIVKYEQIFDLLKEHKIKYQTQKDLKWTVDLPLSYKNYTEEKLKDIFKNCVMASCLSILNNKLHICAKSATASELGLVEVKDSVDLLDKENLKNNIVAFYQKDLFDICRYCSLSDKHVMPAEQLE